MPGHVCYVWPDKPVYVGLGVSPMSGSPEGPCGHAKLPSPPSSGIAAFGCQSGVVRPLFAAMCVHIGGPRHTQCYYGVPLDLTPASPVLSGQGRFPAKTAPCLGGFRWPVRLMSPMPALRPSVNFQTTP